MFYEHVITYKNSLTLADIEYILKKANKLGRLNKSVISIFEEKDKDGTHIFIKFVKG